MAISRSLMNRQLQANGGIMQVTPRENFGIGSKIKKRIRKLIPNELADIAVKAAPFVAPFNPLLAAGMSGIGGFDQTGKIGDSLKSGLKTYALGQGARYLGGADFQGLQNPFSKGAFSSPTGSGGIKNLFKSDVQPVQAINEGQSTFAQDLTQDLLPGDTLNAGDIISGTEGSFKTSGSAMDSFNVIKSLETSAGQKSKAALDLLKRGSKALFYTDGKLDKNAVLGAVTAAASYAEALYLASQAGMDLTEQEYDEAKRAEKKEQYGDYLQNFFGNKRDGGRIGFESGANEMIKTQLLEEIMPNTDTTTEDYVMIMTEDGPKMVLRSELPSESMMMDTTTSAYGDAGRGRPVPEFADGGRIGFKRGSPEETSEVGIMTIDVEAGDDEDEEDMMMAYSDAIFNRPEKAALFRALGDPKIRQTTKSFKNLNNILKNPGMFPEDELVLKQYLKLKGFKDGGRIGYAKGANRVSELLILRDEKIGKDEDVSDIEAEIFQLTGKTFRSVGGISDIPTGNMRKNNAGVVERDYRDEGGFVPVGIKERADDVPAMLSKNEFVMTADAVRGIGNGSVEEGSKKLYNTMKQAEKVGKA